MAQLFFASKTENYITTLTFPFSKWFTKFAWQENDCERKFDEERKIQLNIMSREPNLKLGLIPSELRQTSFTIEKTRV